MSFFRCNFCPVEDVCVTVSIPEKRELNNFVDLFFLSTMFFIELQFICLNKQKGFSAPLLAVARGFNA